MKNIHKHKYFFLFYLLLLVIGISIYSDYGISWDEGTQRRENGIVNYNFIHKGDYENLINGNEKYHGSAFEIFLVYAEHALHLKTMKDIFLMRHILTFLVFYISVLFFYLLCLKQFKSRWLALAGCLFLVLSPRIFADAFYNSKDLVFMALVIINMYFTHRLLNKKNILNAFFHGLISALVIDTRVMGVIIPAFTYLILFIDFIRISDQRFKIAMITVFNIIVLSAFTILCWPVLWRNPVENFILGIQEMSHYHWDSYMLYLGKRADANYTPWHYIPVWMAVTTPLLYTGLFLSGIYFLIRKLLSRINISVFDWFNLYIFFFPVLAVIVLHSVVYDGWRHMFFVYPSFILIALTGLNVILNSNINNRIFVKTLAAGVGCYLIYISGVMAYLHPYENVYFNSLAGKTIEDARKNFEIDYWGLSYMEGIDYILKTDTSSQIFIMPQDNPGRDNLRMFDDKERARLSITASVELADYFLSNYRYHHYPYNLKPDFNITRSNGIICSVFDLRNRRFRLDDKHKIAHYSNNYETAISNWPGGKIISDTNAFSGSKTEQFDSTIEFGAGFNCNAPVEMLNDSSVNYMNITFQLKAEEPYVIRIVCEIDSSHGPLYEWNAGDLESSLTNKWMKQDFRIRLPKINSASDKFKIYIWNDRKNKFSIDDMEIKFFSMPLNEYRARAATMPDVLIED